MADEPPYPRSAELYERARQIIPGGIHLSGRPLVDPWSTPMYFDRGERGHIWDVDGHEYVDLVMAFGPFLLGYAHPEVDRAAEAQGQRGRLLSMNHPVHIRFIEALLPRFPGAEMGVFFRTGSDATTAALRVARRATGRRKVARCGYHGWHDWCLPLESYVPAGLDDQVPEFSAREPATLAALLDQHRGQVAAVIVAPEMVTPHDPAVFTRLAEITRAHGALLIMDEVKTAVRTPGGSISARVGVVPDMITVSKALGNGWPVAALLGRREVMRVGDGMHYSGTFHGDTAAMAAAMRVLELVDETHAAERAWALGERLLAGLTTLARTHRLPAEAYGEPLPMMPFFRFTHPEPEAQARLRDTFYRATMARGVLLHPRHLWFTSAAHTDEDISRVLDVVDESMALAARAL